MPNYTGPKEEPATWWQIRREVYAMHKGICYFCNKPVPENKYIIHHKLQRRFVLESEQSLEGLLRRDGVHNKRNLAPAHIACHENYHNKNKRLFGAR
jgi:hypothetical protein